MRADIQWDDISRDDWERIFASAGRTPLVQSWAYGAAKAEMEGWRPHHATVGLGGETVALALVLEKRIAGIGRVARLNRGPVCLRPLADAEAVAVIRALRAPWRIWKAGVLFIAPELSAEQAGRVVAPRFHRRHPPRWRSAWVDLAQTPEELRKGLDGKWRNMLNAAEKAGLTARVSAKEAERSWLLDRYRQLMADKGFSGTSPAIIESLARHAPHSDDLLVAQAMAESEPVAGVLSVRHGNAATYLVGWNGETGRRLKANNFLLWQVILTLRSQGVRWLDLGGIDPVLTPGIAAFKRGVRGEEYLLAGEFLGL